MPSPLTASSPAVAAAGGPRQAALARGARSAGRAVSRSWPAAGRTLAHAVWPVALILLTWAAWVELADIPPAVAPAPGRVLAYIADHPMSFVRDAAATAAVVVGGLLLGAAAGGLLATVSWFSPVARAVINGPALLTQCLPIVTIAPVLARVFGYGTMTILVIAGLISFFPVLVFATAGMRATPPGSDDLFRVLGAGRWQRYRRLALPSALPSLLVALRMSTVAAVVGAMLAQWIMGTSGLGFRLAVAQSSFRTAEAWASSLVAIVLSVVLNAIATTLCRVARERLE
ncbi:MAG: ABC transporter permease subunit [Frankia sp.]|nr:ABC transporter permease subunit [Frankia sp.]